MITMAYGYNCSGCIADVDTDRMRADFEYIFNANAIEVELIKNRPDFDVNPGGDFFGTREKPIVQRQIVRMHITAEQSNAYQRTKQGILTNSIRLKGMAKWDTPLDNDDLIKLLQTPGQACFGVKKGEVFVIEDFNKPFYHGQYTWQEFTLRRVDHDDQFVKRSPR